MKALKDISSVYFIGIGGIGMSAIARYFHEQGVIVAGYDRTMSPITKALQLEGIQINFQDDLTEIPFTPDLVVYTPAIPDSNQILTYCRDQNWTVKKRSEVLGMISKDMYAIAVAGSHGKTTVSSMIAHILKDSGYDCTAFLGGIALNFDSNFCSGANDVVVIEADEYDRSFLQLDPNVAVITAIDSDHLDIYGSIEKVRESFDAFASRIDNEGALINREGIEGIENYSGNRISYSVSDSTADLHISRYTIEDGAYHFITNDKVEWILPMGGKHNMENALAAISVCRYLEIDDTSIRMALMNFKGIARRFQLVAKTDDKVFIDDYAHHPEEIKAFIGSLKELYPQDSVCVAFQPHLFSRTRDLASEFAQSLSLADEVFVLPIYPAREEPIDGVTSELITKEISGNARLIEKERLADALAQSESRVVATVGAGDIDRLVEPISKMIKNESNA